MSVRVWLPRRLRSISPRTVGIVLVVVSLLANAVVGFLLLTTRAEVDALARCSERYNRQEGVSIEARDAVARTITATEAALWEAYVRSFDAALAADGAGDAARVRTLQVGFRNRLEGYAAELRRLNDTRDANPYPDPNLCRTLVP